MPSYLSTSVERIVRPLALGFSEHRFNQATVFDGHLSLDLVADHDWFHDSLLRFHQEINRRGRKPTFIRLRPGGKLIDQVGD